MGADYFLGHQRPALSWLPQGGAHPSPTLPALRREAVLLKQLKREESFHCQLYLPESTSCAAKKTIFTYCPIFFCHKNTVSLTKEAMIGCSSCLYNLLLKLPLSFWKWRMHIGSPYWVIWHWKPFYKHSLLIKKMPNKPDKPSHGGRRQHGLLSLVPSSKDSSPTLASKVDQLEGMLKMLREDLKKVKMHPQSRSPGLCKLPLNCESPF